MKPGDVVCLKSGSFKMTVERRVDNGQWYCVWWSPKEEQIVGRVCYEESLELA